jgi:hypothetical protein
MVTTDAVPAAVTVVVASGSVTVSGWRSMV